MMTEDGRPSALESIEDIQAEKCDVLASESRANDKGPLSGQGPFVRYGRDDNSGTR